MITEKIYKYFLKELSMRKLIWSKLGNIYFVYFLIIGIPLIVMGILIYFFGITSFLYYNPILLIIYILIIKFMLWNVLKKVYKINANLLFVSSKELDNYRKTKIKDYFQDEGIVNQDQYHYLIKLLEKQVEDNKIPFYLKSGFTAAILLPGWVSFCNWIFYPERILNWNDLVSAGSIFFISVVTIFFIYKFITNIYTIFYDKYDIYKKISDLTKDLYLTSILLKNSFQEEANTATQPRKRKKNKVS